MLLLISLLRFFYQASYPNSSELSLKLSDISDATFFFASLTNAQQENKMSLEEINPTQGQLDEAIYDKDKPPKYLVRTKNSITSEHPILTVNPDRAYKWADRNGVKCRRFVESGEWIPNNDDDPDDPAPPKRIFIA